MISKISVAFRKRLVRLPPKIQRLAFKNYRLWLQNQRHISVNFKRFKGTQWSARVGDHYRAVGYYADRQTFVWTWIGTHEEYNKL
jgi:mRNA-degrading endonuclease RelE of RelBE toxin-antitoxin system